MANQLTLKVSEEKVRTAITKLETSIKNMKEHLGQLQTHRQRLADLYRGRTALTGIGAIKTHEDKIQAQIEKLVKEKDALVAYLDIMNTADTNISNAYQAAQNEANNLFV